MVSSALHKRKSQTLQNCNASATSKANKEYKNIYNIYQVGQIAILNHKETIICEKTVAYQTLQKYDPNQQQDNKIETLLSTSCQPLDVVNINRVHKKINIFTFNSQPYNITKAYCKLFRGLLNKENIIVAGNVRNNIQLQNEPGLEKSGQIL